jgi:hypothetical protein
MSAIDESRRSISIVWNQSKLIASERPVCTQEAAVAVSLAERLLLTHNGHSADTD